MKANFGKYIESTFWPKISKSKIIMAKNNLSLTIPPNKKISFLKKLEQEYYKLGMTRKGIVAANIIAFINGWEALPLLITGSVIYLYYQAKKINNTPSKIYKIITGEDLLPSTNQSRSILTDTRNFNYDPTTIGVNDLQIGFLIDYNLKTYQTIEHYQLNSNSDIKEEKIILLSGINELIIFKFFDQSNLKIRVVEKINVYSVNEKLDTEILLKQKPSSILTFMNKKFYRDTSIIGNIYSYRDKKVINKYSKWDYYDDERKEYLCIEQIGTKTFSAYYGKLVHETAFSDILPKN